jgi:hypothetical protein
VADAYAAESKTEKPDLGVLIDWVRSKTAELQGADMLVYDVCHHVVFFTLRGLASTGKTVYVPGPYVLERDQTENLVKLQPLRNIPAISSDDELLQQIARQFTPADKKLADTYDHYPIDLLNDDNTSKKATTKSGLSEAKKLKETTSDVPKEDKCTFIVGPEKTEIVWDRTILAKSNPTLSKILYGSGEIKTDPSKPIEWLDFDPASTKLVFESLPKSWNGRSAAVSDQVYKGCKVLADYLGIEFRRLFIKSDRFADEGYLQKYENCDIDCEDED